MPDYSHASPPNLFPSQQSSHTPSSPSSPETNQQIPRRRVKEQMGEGFYKSMEETNGNESPNKRARTGSLSDHGTAPNSLSEFAMLTWWTEADPDNMVTTPVTNEVNQAAASDAETNDESTIPSTPPSKEAQLNALKMSFVARLGAGATVYLVPVKWFLAFAAWARGETGQEPGSVDPAASLLENGEVSFYALENRDWHATTEEGWNLIKRCHGVESEVQRQVIYSAPHSTNTEIELRPPQLVLTKIVPPPTMSNKVFDFAAAPTFNNIPKATSIHVSKSDTIDTLDSMIRSALSLSSSGEIRCYKFPIKRSDNLLSQMTPPQISRLLPDRDDHLDLLNKFKSVGEIGIVESYVAIAVEWKADDGTWPMDEDTSSSGQSSVQGTSSSDVSYSNGGGRTLGAAPNSFTALNRPRRQSNDKSVFDSEDEGSSYGRQGGQLIGPTLPGSYPRTTSPTQLLRSSSSERYGERYKTSFNSRFMSAAKQERVRGTTGLNNLGNTCYMNSALQCLVHCKELTEYFLAQVYKSELNETNPLGMNGLLAKHYAYLVSALFNADAPKASFPPSEFKKTIGRFAPNFSGYGQQDSQEFLAFLLDGLHEDLNRVKQKPYVERDELVGVEPTEEQLRSLGQKSWDGHKLRNDSVIVDLCQGMYKSTVVCPVCEVVSVTFDPFMDLSVPLPIKQTWKHPHVHFIPNEGKSVQMAVELPKSATIRDLKKVVGDRMGVDPSKLMSAEIFSKKFYKHHTDEMALAEAVAEPIRDNVTIYELPELGEPDSVVLPVIHGHYEHKSYHLYNPSGRFDEFGIPLYIVLTKDEKHDFDKIYAKVRRRYEQFSDAEELRVPTNTEDTKVEETADDSMEDVVLTRQDVNQSMVTIRLQPYRQTSYSYGRSNEVEMPTTVEKPETLYDLREFLNPTPARMDSVAPSAMESVHQDVPTSPDSDDGGGFVNPLDINNPLEDGNTSEGTMFLSQQGDAIDSAPNGSPQDSGFQDLDNAFPETTMRDDVDEAANDPNSLSFSDSEMVYTGEDGRTTPNYGMVDSDDDQLDTSSQLGEKVDRAHAPSPINLPPYSSLYSHYDVPTRESSTHELKFGDALVCEWSDAAYSHVFQNYKYTTYWNTFETWTDPTPPPLEPSTKKTNIDLDDCLDEFAREEQLGEADLWYCPRCKEHRQARKTLQLWRVPDIFAVHLKRFSANRGFRDKLDNLIEFPISDLDLTERVGDKMWVQEERGGEKLIYDLFAVDNHYGGLGGGHYTAYAQNFEDGKWYYFDDSSVRLAKADDSVTTAAYLLFYRRRSETPLGGSTSKLITEYVAKVPPTVNESDSSTTSPKADIQSRSASSTPPPLLSVINKSYSPGFLDTTLLTIDYSPLNTLKLRDPSSGNSGGGVTGWHGGWSNRNSAAGASSNLGFQFGANSIRPGAESSSPGPESQNNTPDAADADVESGDEENEIEVVPIEVDMDKPDDVQVIQLDPMDGDDQQHA